MPGPNRGADRAVQEERIGLAPTQSACRHSPLPSFRPVVSRMTARAVVSAPPRGGPLKMVLPLSLSQLSMPVEAKAIR